MNELWDAEFRGFFWGEGCITLVPYHSRPGGPWLIRPQMGIGLRDDDEAMCLAMQERFGGHIFRFKASTTKSGHHFPHLEWKVVQQRHIREVCRVLSAGLMPAKKRREVDIMVRYLDVAHGMGKKYTTEEYVYLWSLVQEMRDIKKYRDTKSDQAISA